LRADGQDCCGAKIDVVKGAADIKALQEELEEEE